MKILSSKEFDNLINEIKINENNERDKGTAFENLVVAYLKNEPAFKNQYSNVWLLRDVPEEYGISKIDTGVDIVARKYNGDLTAVQAKFYENKVGKDTINSFIAETSKDYYSDGLIVSTTDDWNRNAERAITGNTKPIIRKGLSDLRHASIDWKNFGKSNDNNLSIKSTKKLREYQKKAIENAVEYFKSDEEHHNRGKLIMAPGTGKTFTSLKISEALMRDQMKNKFNVLYLVPSIQLLSQTLFNWNDDVSDDIHMTSFSVVSDRKATKKTRNDDSILTAKDVGFPATTNVDELINNYNSLKELNINREMTVVFSTYQSIDVIKKAQEFGYPEFDLIIADEAHRTTGANKLNEDSMFTEVHSNSNVKGKLRLYQTATPKIYDQNAKKKAVENSIVVSSMDDPEKYGYEIFRLGFGDAVAQGYLTDYKVSVLAVNRSYINKNMSMLLSSDNSELQTAEIGKIIGVWNAMVKRNGNTGEITGSPMKRAIAFTNTIDNSKKISNEFQTVVNKYLDVQSSESFKIDVHHVDGGLNSLQKNTEIDWLSEDAVQNNHARVLSNVKFLTEGIDVPNLDAIIFFSPKKSQVDIVQAVGRIMRRAENKEYGYIILPIVVDDDADPSYVLDNNKDFKTVWSVLNALRSTDDRFDAEVNKIDLNKINSGRIDLNTLNDSPDKPITEDMGLDAEKRSPEQLELQLNANEFKDAFYGKVVEKVGNRRYLEDWSKDVADIAKRHITRISDIIESNDGAKMAFDNFLNSLHYNINNSIGKEQAIEMLAQHLITEPIFEALFGEYSFVRNNAVSKAMNDVVGAFSLFGFDKEQAELKPFYDSIKLRATGIDNAAGKQKLILTLYDKFFRTGFKKTTEQLGIVFTPVEVVDFIVNSVDASLRKYFDKSLSNKNVHILDPFTGTGTFMTRLLYHFKEQLDKGEITFEDILSKYTHDMHANEIVLLSYYIAAINIESTFEEINNEYGNEKNDYKQFEGIVLTDTFASTENKDTLDDKIFGENDERLKKEQETPLTVIMGNPPYSARQKNANDDNANVQYEKLDEEIRKTYAKNSDSVNRNTLYDSYIRAIRWATDRIGEAGVIGFITNNGYIESASTNGLRRDLYKNFNHIYVYNLLGGVRGKTGDFAKREGKSVFDIMTGVAIVILVKDNSDSHELKYSDIGYYLDKKQKLNKIKLNDNIFNVDFHDIIPNDFGDWINQRDPNYEKYPYMKDIFNIDSQGVRTNRDKWVYNFDYDMVKQTSSTLVSNFNSELDRLSPVTDNDKKIKMLNNDSTFISWSKGLQGVFKSGNKLSFDEDKIKLSLYRPFTKKYLYYGNSVIEGPGKFKEFLGDNNICIIMSSGRTRRGFSVLVTNEIPDGNSFDSGTRAFALYDNSDRGILVANGSNYNISNDFISKVGLSEQDAFYYIYGLLNSKEYVEKYYNDLTKDLPHIPVVQNKEKYVFYGRKLMDLHLNYEKIEPYNDLKIDKKDNSSYEVKKMKFSKKYDSKLKKKVSDKSIIIFNDDIVIREIPEKAYNYVINGKSAIEWIMDQYQVKTDKSSNIIDDPNKYVDNSRYIYELLLKVINVSVQTVDIINSMPKFKV